MKSQASLECKIIIADKATLGSNNGIRAGQDKLAVKIASKYMTMKCMGNRLVPINHPDDIKWHRFSGSNLLKLATAFRKQVVSSVRKYLSSKKFAPRVTIHLHANLYKTGAHNRPALDK